MRESAVYAAREERAESIKDGEEAKVKAKSEGIEIVSLSKEDMKKFEEATQSVYEKFHNYFTPGLISRIKN